MSIRPTGARMHLRRVVNRTALILSVYEKYGVTDGIYHLGEVLGLGPRFESEVPVEPGDLVLFMNSRVHDHFRWERVDVLVYPGEHLYAKVTDCFLVSNPGLREYEREPA